MRICTRTLYTPPFSEKTAYSWLLLYAKGLHTKTYQQPQTYSSKAGEKKKKLQGAQQGDKQRERDKYGALKRPGAILKNRVWVSVFSVSLLLFQNRPFLPKKP